MTAAVRVAVESSLLQLDREFDFLIPDDLKNAVQWGSRVSFTLGRAKRPTTGLVIDLLETSEYASTFIQEVIGDRPYLNLELLQFCKEVSSRQVVALGEILQLACPPHMPKIAIDPPSAAPSPIQAAISNEVILTSVQERVGDRLIPSWAREFAERAAALYQNGQSSILIAPEASDVDVIAHALGQWDVEPVVWETTRKSRKFQNFHRCMNQKQVVIGTRSCIYAPVANLGLIAVADDLDESYQEIGSPHTNLRDLALIRSSNRCSVLFAAPYRSVELQRLVEIGYLKDDSNPKVPRIAFSQPGVRIDDTSLNLAKQSLVEGTLLVLLPRKGSSSAAFCADCGDRIRCECGGYVWEPKKDRFECRICGSPISSCRQCRSTSFRRGRSGSARTTSEIGKMFPNATVYEATQEKMPTISNRANQIVVATPGSAPRLLEGYSGLLVLDCDVWLSAQTLNSEHKAFRDWSEAIELLNPNARAVFAGLGGLLGKPLALWQHREIAKASYRDAKLLRLPPVVRTVSVSGTLEQIKRTSDLITAHGAQLIRNTGTKATYKFDYSVGAKVCADLRSVAVSAKAIQRGSKNVRGLSIAMDDLEAI